MSLSLFFPPPLLAGIRQAEQKWSLNDLSRKVVTLGLKYPGIWKFEGVGFGIPTPAIDEFIELIVKIADGSKTDIEGFKAAFGSSVPSSSYDWAVNDLYTIAERESSNAAVFIDNLWKGIKRAELRGLPVPSHRSINKILAKHRIPIKVDPPNLLRTHDSAIVDAAIIAEDDASKEAVPFILGEEIGTGGYGIVYRATRTTSISDFEFALKVLDPSPFVEDYNQALRRFQREIKALQVLQHRSIVQYFEAGLTVDNKPYVVMPLIKGIDLRSAASASNLTGVVDMFIEVLLALQYAHNQGVIHRDLKPSNIIVRSSDRQPIILDFGSAYILDQLDSQSLTSQAVGTVGYIPSEVLVDPKKRSPLHDVYACGVMLYESFAQCRPDPANYVSLTKIDQAYGVLDRIIEQAIAGERTRTSSAREFANQLAALRIDSIDQPT